MKKLIFVFLILQSLKIFALDRIGNGGGLWTCSWNHSLKTGVLVDLYEAQEEFGLTLITSTEADPSKIIQERSDFVRLHLPQYSEKWNPYLSEVLRKIRLVNSELVIIDDALFRMKPSPLHCASEWIYMQFANFTNQDQVLIRKDLWNSPVVEPLHKAALIWHEVIYQWLREHYQDKDSVRTRQIVGYLFSTLPPSQMIEKIQQVLKGNITPPPPPPPPPPKQWICLIHNNHISMYYAGYGESRLEAKTQTLQQCQSSKEAFFCPQEPSHCEEIIKIENAFTCQNKNDHIHQIYLGKGRSLLEAEFKAREACQQTEYRFFWDQKVSCE